MKKQQTWVMLISALTGIIILIDGFFEVPILSSVRGFLLEWAVILFTVLLVFSTLDTILSQLRSSRPSSSELIIHAAGFASFLIMLLLGLPNGSEGDRFSVIFNTIQTSVETTLAGLICPAFLFALYKLPSRRSQTNSVMVHSFFWGFFLFLIFESGILDYAPIPKIALEFIDWLKCIPLGTFIGILVGMAVGAVITGIRFLFFGSHPYKERK